MAKTKRSRVYTSSSLSLIGALGFLVGNHFDMKSKTVGGRTLHCFKRRFGLQTKMSLDGFMFCIASALNLGEGFLYEIYKITGKKQIIINVTIIEED